MAYWDSGNRRRYLRLGLGVSENANSGATTVTKEDFDRCPQSVFQPGVTIVKGHLRRNATMLRPFVGVA